MVLLTESAYNLCSAMAAIVLCASHASCKDLLLEHLNDLISLGRKLICSVLIIVRSHLLWILDKSALLVADHLFLQCGRYVWRVRLRSLAIFVFSCRRELLVLRLSSQLYDTFGSLGAISSGNLDFLG